jgi:hypothetical protein
MAKGGSKRQVAIDIMNSNRDKSPLEIIELIAAANSLNGSAARSYYKWIIENGLVTGLDMPQGKVKSEAKDTVAVIKRVKEPKIVVESKPSTDKSDDEIAAIRAKNLETIKAVAAKVKQKKRDYLPGQVAAPAKETPADFDPEAARAEVEAMYKELDSYSVPEFLKKDQLKHLV